MAKRYDLTIDQGATYALDIECQDENGDTIDLSGVIPRSQIRYTYKDVSPALEFSASISGGIVSLSLSPAQTSALSKSYGVWDCELEFEDGTVQRLLEGKVIIRPEVTR